MLLIPAIDIKQGRCVRLRQGRMDEETVFSDDPLEVANRWVDAGARRLHLVDLNGAFAGHPVNFEVIRKIGRGLPTMESGLQRRWPGITSSRYSAIRRRANSQV